MVVVVVVVVEAFALQQLSVTVSSWEELVSKREWRSHWRRLWCFRVGLGPMCGTFVGRFACSFHSGVVLEGIRGGNFAVCDIVATEVVGGGEAGSLAGVLVVGRLLGVEIVEGRGVVVGV